MDLLNKNFGPSPHVPAHNPSCPPKSQPSTPPAPSVPIPPGISNANPLPLMSINTFPDIQSEMNSPPRKSRRKERSLFTAYSENKCNWFNKVDENWPRFYIITKKEGDFSQISPFVYCQQIIKAVGKPKLVQKMASGALNVEAVSIDQAKILKGLKMLGDHEIMVDSNKRRNTSRGVVVCRDFMVCSEEELKVGMADQGVIDVRRINRRQGGTLVATASLILTFDTPEPPLEIEAAYYKLKVRKFIPSPMRCFKCLKFGHTSVRCRSAGQMCACGLVIHENSPCQDPPVCINCADPHSSRSPECIVFKEEKEIQKVKTLQNMPYKEAKELVRSKSFVKPGISYATAAKPKPVEKKDWSKILQPFIFTTGNQGPSKPVWVTQDHSRAHIPPVPSHPTEAGVSRLPSSVAEGNTFALNPNLLPTSSKAEDLKSEQFIPVRPISARLPQRSPPRKERPLRKIKSLSAPQPEKEENVIIPAPPCTSETKHIEARAVPINWVSSREEHGSDSETGDSNRTVLTDSIQAPIERPVVRRKRKGMPKNSRK